MRNNVLNMNANPPKGWIPVFGVSTDDADDQDYQSAIAAAVRNGGHVYLYSASGAECRAVLSAALTLPSNITLEIGANVVLDATGLTVPCLTATNKSNIRITGDGKIVCKAASVPTFTSVTGLECSVSVQDGSANILAYSATSCTFIRQASPFMVGTSTIGGGKEIFNVTRTDTNARAVTRPTMVYMEDTVSPAATLTHDFHALDVKLQTDGANANYSSNIGLYAVEGKNTVEADSGQTLGRSVGVYGVTVASMSNGTLFNAIGLQGEVQVNTGGAVGNGAGLWIKTPSVAGGTVTSVYGIYIEDQTGGSTRSCAIRTNAGQHWFNSGTAIPAGGTAGLGLCFSSTANFGVFFGSGAPTLVAAKGSLYLRSDGSSTSTRLYVATDSAGAWTAITTAT